MKTDYKSFAQRPASAGPFIADRCRVRPARYIDCPVGPMGGIWFRCELFSTAGEGYGSVLAFQPDQPPSLDVLKAVLKTAPESFGRIA